MNDDGRNSPDTEEWMYFFSRKSLEVYMKNFDWFGFANAWSYCHWFSINTIMNFRADIEYLILNNLGSFSKQDPYFCQELVENLTCVHATNRRIESDVFRGKLDKVLIDIFEAYVGLIERFEQNVKPEPSVARSGSENTSFKRTKHSKDNPTKLDLMDIHNLAINCFNQTSFEKNRKVLELYLEFGKLMDDSDSMYQYVSVLFAILSNNKPESLKDILVDTFDAIEEEIWSFGIKNQLCRNISRGNF